MTISSNFTLLVKYYPIFRYILKGLDYTMTLKY
ncbi:hypothetical protein [Staphylococcus phage vB_SauM-V1SA22]|nr:hypothetical protein [Staphylococcus phage vB_SauM-V1SA22]